MADSDTRRGERVTRRLVRGARDAVDEGGLTDVGVAGDDDRRFVGTQVGQRTQVGCGGVDRLQVVSNRPDDVGEPGEGLLAVGTGQVLVGSAHTTEVVALYFVGLSRGPVDVSERSPDGVEVDDGGGQVLVERVDTGEVGPPGDDVRQVVRTDVARSADHRLLGVATGLRPPGPRRPRERLVDETLGVRSVRQVLEYHTMTAGHGVKGSRFRPRELSSVRRQRKWCSPPTTGMTDWTAVLSGVVAGIIVGVAASAVPGIGHVFAGLVGGGVAGYLAGGSVASGLWHGILAGAFGGILLAAALFSLVSVASVALGAPFGVLAGVGTASVVVVVSLLFAVDSAVGGAVGAALS